MITKYKRMTVLVPIDRYQKFINHPEMGFRNVSGKINELIEDFINNNKECCQNLHIEGDNL